MKTLKWISYLICIGFLLLLYFQNEAYFTTLQSFTIDLKVKSWSWTSPQLMNVCYWGTCFALGFVWAALMWAGSKFKSKQVIKSLNSTIDSHAAQISSLRTELEVFTNDPYIKKDAQKKKEIAQKQEKEQETKAEDNNA